MIAHPEGWLERAGKAVRASGAQLIVDEVMTGFGRTGEMFACQKEKVTPDFLCVAKGLTGGYLPMAATLTTQPVFDAFLGEYSEFKTFFHGHSYTGNQLGSAVALASLEILQGAESKKKRRALEKQLRNELESLWPLAPVGDIRQEGLVAGVELVADWRTRKALPLKAQAGIRVCESMGRRGVLTRPIGNVIPLLPPYCTTQSQIRKMVRALREAIVEVLGGARV
jgi:adenosylmethionine-8-amino-7-oxononanoate aminotransferase